MLKRILFVAAGLSVILCLYLSYDYWSFSREREELVRTTGQETTDTLKDQVDTILRRIVDEGERLSKLLGTGDLTAAEIEEIIKASSLSITEIQGVTACFEPFAFSPDRRLYCPYYDKGISEYFFVDSSYDYSIAGPASTAWYTGVRDEGAKWVEPYFAQGMQDWFVDYGVPFYYTTGDSAGRVRGTITMSFMCSGFKELVHALSLGKTGFGLITSNEGKFLAHPVAEYIGAVGLADIAANETRRALSDAYASLLRGEKGDVSFDDPEQQDEAVFFYDTIPTSGWGLGILYHKNDLLADERTNGQKYVKLSLAYSLLIFAFLALFYGRDNLDEKEIWTLSSVATVILLFNIVLIGFLEHNAFRMAADDASPAITDLTSIGSFINQQHARSERLKTPKLRAIPTGIYIEKLEFSDSYNVNVGGSIWQKYPLELVDEVEIGFDLPQMSPFAEASFVEETYRKEVTANEDVGGYLLVRWAFRATLRLNLKYSNYPFDKRHINIEIVPKNRQDHLLLTPDLASYNFTNPAKKSGLNRNIEISGSEVLQTYYNYSLETYGTDFGSGVKGMFEEVPVLHFNVNVRRVLLNEFITYLIPIVVAMIMVFILAYACGKTEERQGIIESMAAFSFVLIFSHIDLRKEIVTADLTYMEYFYFVGYFMLILSTTNLITYSKNKSAIFDFGDNLIFKSLFFPLMFGILLLITLAKFY